MKDTVYIFISPHLDDVVFSCGGYVRQLVAAGNKVVVATVITADDQSGLPLAWLARRNLRSWRGDRDIFTVRCSEDLMALRKLGAEIIHLSFLDCIYRRDASQAPLYTKRVINVPVHPYDLATFKPELEQKLKALLEQYASENMVIVCPLTIGGHVDHIIVRQAVEATTSLDRRLYYEDFPYALRIGDVASALEGLNSTLVQLKPHEIEARLDASASYSSQIPGLFPTQIEIIREIIGAYLPFVEKFFPQPPSVDQSIQRMMEFTCEYIQQVGGERYWTNDKK